MKGIVKQLSIFVNNEPGALAHMTKQLLNCNVNIKAFNIAESEGFGVLRAIVENPEENAKKLKKLGVVVKLTDVLVISLSEDPGSLHEVVDKIAESKTNIEYAYAHRSNGKAVLFIKAENPGEMLEFAKRVGLPLVDDEEIE